MIAFLFSLLAARSALAQTGDSQGPLSPGKPAGVHGAQMVSNGTVFVAALAVILVAGVYLASKPYQIPGQSTASTASTSP